MSSALAFAQSGFEPYRKYFGFDDKETSKSYREKIQEV
jgi:hypothetical protein